MRTALKIAGSPLFTSTVTLWKKALSLLVPLRRQYYNFLCHLPLMRSKVRQRESDTLRRAPHSPPQQLTSARSVKYNSLLRRLTAEAPEAWLKSEDVITARFSEQTQVHPFFSHLGFATWGKRHLSPPALPHSAALARLLWEGASSPLHLGASFHGTIPRALVCSPGVASLRV